MIEEDEVLIKLETRREALQAVVQEDAAMGKPADNYIVQKVKNLTEQINELRELHVL